MSNSSYYHFSTARLYTLRVPASPHALHTHGTRPTSSLSAALTSSTASTSSTHNLTHNLLTAWVTWVMCSNFVSLENERRGRRGRAIMRTRETMMPTTTSREHWDSYVRPLRYSWPWTEFLDAVLSTLRFRQLSPHSMERLWIRMSLCRVQEVEMKFFFGDELLFLVFFLYFGRCIWVIVN